MIKLLRRQFFHVLSTIYRRIDLARRDNWEEKTTALFGSFGKGSRIFPYSVFVDPGNIFIGNNVHIRNNCYFQGNGKIHISDNNFISRYCTIFSATHNYSGKLIPYDDENIIKPVTLERNVWIGMNVTIVPGVTVGEGAIIGLGTVVTTDVPPLAIVGSMGERILKYRDKEHYDRLVSEGRFCRWGGVPLND